MFRNKEPEFIGHEGIVQSRSQNMVVVKITSSSACSSCHAGNACGMAGREEKLIEVSGSYDLKPGDNVKVIMKQEEGYSALMLGYIFPLIIVLVTLITLSSLSVPELKAGLGSIVSLILYYIILRLFRRKIGQRFTFSLISDK
jgi:positive regulator of sigma E activity